MASHNDLGELGEQKAVDFLIQKGYQILTRNYRFKKHELDIVAQDKEELVVVEVKTRQSHYLTDPDQLVSKSKQKGLVQAANGYIQNQEFDGECRFDVVIIIHNAKGTEIQHIEDAFYPTL